MKGGDHVGGGQALVGAATSDSFAPAIPPMARATGVAAQQQVGANFGELGFSLGGLRKLESRFAKSKALEIVGVETRCFEPADLCDE